MTQHAADLFAVAERLDESPTELLNGGAADALRVLDESADEMGAVADAHGIEAAHVDALLDRAGSRLRELPEPDEVYPAAAEAATLLYAAAWLLNADSVATEDLQILM